MFAANQVRAKPMPAAKLMGQVDKQGLFTGTLSRLHE